MTSEKGLSSEERLLKESSFKLKLAREGARCIMEDMFNPAPYREGHIDWEEVDAICGVLKELEEDVEFWTKKVKEEGDSNEENK